MDIEDDLVAFFAALPAAAREEYLRLAARDRRYGEDVRAELDEPAAGEEA